MAVQLYTLFLHEDVARTFAALSHRDQHVLAGAFDGLKAHPFRTGDYREADTEGRTQEVMLVEKWLITFRADHAVHEMRILRLESVEE